MQWIWLFLLHDREYKIEVRDASFQPAIIVVEEGDRIWWEWSKDKVAMITKLNTFSQNVLYHNDFLCI